MRILYEVIMSPWQLIQVLVDGYDYSIRVLGCFYANGIVCLTSGHSGTVLVAQISPKKLEVFRLWLGPISFIVWKKLISEVL